jgi:PAS domain S-box-containing protein
MNLHATPPKPRPAPAPVRVPPGPPRRTGLAFLDEEGVVRQIDPALARALGYAPDALVGTFFFAFIHARDLAPVLKDAAALLQHRKRAACWTFRFRTAGGDWYRLAARAAGRASPAGLALAFTDPLGAGRAKGT